MFVNLLDNREKAIVIWLLIFVIWVSYVALFKRDVRSSLVAVLKALLQKKIIMVLGAMLSYVGLTIFVLRKMHFWDISLLVDTVFWVFGTGFVLMFNMSSREQQYFKNILLDNLKLVLILEFVVNLYTFNLWVELIIIPVMTLIACMSIVAGAQKEYVAVKKLMDVIMGLFGLHLIGFAVSNIFANFRAFVTLDNLRVFLLPILLTTLFLPFIYILVLYMTYESMFVRLRIGLEKSKKLVRFAKLKIFRTCLLNLGKLTEFSSKNAISLSSISNENDVLNMIHEFRGRKRNC